MSTRKTHGTPSSAIAAFRSAVWSHYRAHGRHALPWRKTRDPYKILVSEMMLQQTQVERVVPKYRSFLKEFPTVQALAKAPLLRVLKEWSGLGYNRRAKYLRDTAIQIIKTYDSMVPREYESLRALTGVGEYTACAVRVFAWNEPDTLIETNIRTALIHHFFQKYKGRSSLKVKDADVMPVATKAAEGEDPRLWHWALMDYGSYLKRSGVKNNARSAHYAKQRAFKGSLREVRGAILKAVAEGHLLHLLQSGRPAEGALLRLPFSEQMLWRALESLVRDGLIVRERGKR